MADHIPVVTDYCPTETASSDEVKLGAARISMAQSISLWYLMISPRAALVQLAHSNLPCYRTKGMVLIFQEAER